MAEKEKIEIISIDEVTTIEQIRNNIKGLKGDLDTLTVGTKEYQDTLATLKVNQNALKDAMYATSSSMEDVAASATGTSESYNSLVHRMAALKEEFRATNDEARRLELGQQIKSVNDQLKEMDAVQGNFQRNVGNYAGSIKDAFKGLAEKTDAFGKSVNLAGGGINGFKDGFEAFGKSPAIATFGILVSVVMKLAGSLKENETAMGAVKKAMAALKPVMDFLSGVVEAIAQVLADVIGKVVTFVTSNGIFDKIIKGAMGVGNAVLQFIIAPVKGVIEAVKVFKEKGVKGLGDAARAFGQEMKSGVSFKENFKTGQTVADTIIAGAASRKPKAKSEAAKAGKEIGDELGKEIGDELGKAIEDALASLELEDMGGDDIAVGGASGSDRNGLGKLDRGLARRKDIASLEIENEREKQAALYDLERKGQEERLALLKQYEQEALHEGAMEEYLGYQEQIADAEFEMWKSAKEREAQLNEDKIADLQAYAAAASGVLSGVADALESFQGEAGKNANAIKAMRIASAIIDTISGATGAFMQASQTIPPPFGQIVGAAQAAAITAAGVAQIAKMRSTQIAGGKGSSSAPSTSVSAPSVGTAMTSVRSVTSGSEDARLDQMAFGEQRVYIVASDIETALHDRQVQVAESTY